MIDDRLVGIALAASGFRLVPALSRFVFAAGLSEARLLFLDLCAFFLRRDVFGHALPAAPAAARRPPGPLGAAWAAVAVRFGRAAVAHHRPRAPFGLAYAVHRGREYFAVSPEVLAILARIFLPVAFVGILLAVLVLQVARTALRLNARAPSEPPSAAGIFLTLFPALDCGATSRFWCFLWPLAVTILPSAAEVAGLAFLLLGELRARVGFRGVVVGPRGQPVVH